MKLLAEFWSEIFLIIYSVYTISSYHRLEWTAAQTAGALEYTDCISADG